MKLTEIRDTIFKLLRIASEGRQDIQMKLTNLLAVEKELRRLHDELKRYLAENHRCPHCGTKLR